MPWCQEYFGIVQIFEGDLVPGMSRLAAALLEPLEVLKRYGAACFALMYVAGRAGQLCLTKITDSNLAVSEENPVPCCRCGIPEQGQGELLGGFLLTKRSPPQLSLFWLATD